MSEAPAVMHPEHDNSQILPIHNANASRVSRRLRIQPEGESGRRGIHPTTFLTICFRSSCTLSKFVNCLWPFVPVALAMVMLTFTKLCGRISLTIRHYST